MATIVDLTTQVNGKVKREKNYSRLRQQELYNFRSFSGAIQEN